MDNNQYNFYKNQSWVHLAIILILLNAFGFPGSYTRVFGESMGKLIEYTSFILQLMIMTASSANRFIDMKLIDLKGRYLPIYLFLVEMFLFSMLVTIDRKEQLVSCIRVSVTILFAIWLSTYLTVRELLTEIYYAQVLFVFASAAFPVLFRAYDWRPASYANDFVGIGGVKNVVASELSFGIIMQILLWRLREKYKEKSTLFFFLFLGIQFVLLVMTHGTGPMLTAIIPIAYFFWFEQTKKRFPIGLIYVVASVMFIVVALTVIPLFEPILTAMGEDPTLTGRVPLWRQMIRVLQNHYTLFGCGYGMFWKTPQAVGYMHAGFDSFSFMGNMTSGAHNNTLELWANLGLVGAATFFGMILLSFARVYSIEEEHYLFAFAYVFQYMVHGFTERSWGTYEYNMCFIFLSAAMALGGSKKQSEVLVWKKSQPSSQPAEGTGKLLQGQ